MARKLEIKSKMVCLLLILNRTQYKYRHQYYFTIYIYFLEHGPCYIAYIIVVWRPYT